MDMATNTSDSSPPAEQADADDDGRALTASFIDQLGTCVGAANKKANFACGGVIPILSRPGVGAVNENDTAHPVASTPVTLRWDAHMPDSLGIIHTAYCRRRPKLTFPLAGDDTRRAIDELIEDMTSATFGNDGEDVMDIEDLNEFQMDPEMFSTTFNPYDVGIVDTIAQMLLPSALDSPRYCSVRAELHKLNVYSGPSGRFKPRVDTPGSDRHIGSLVVCLPVAHEGGQLAVRHDGREMQFDWGTEVGDNDHASIRWAAFYNDCEHEVLEVISGHRVTLTYHLYATRGNGRLSGYAPALDPASLPLYQLMSEVLAEEKFMQKGGYLGFFTSHTYPHNDPLHCVFPDMLKGSDMAIWETARSLGLKANVWGVVLDIGRDRGWICGTELESSYVSYKYHNRDEVLEDLSDGFPKYRRIQWANHCLPDLEGEQLRWFGIIGNDNKLLSVYSECAIIIEIPSFEKREASEDDYESDS